MWRHSNQVLAPSYSCPIFLTVALSIFRVPDLLESLVKGSNSSFQFCSDWSLGPLQTSALGDVGHQCLLPVPPVRCSVDRSWASLRIGEFFHLVACIEPACQSEAARCAHLAALLRASDSGEEPKEGWARRGVHILSSSSNRRECRSLCVCLHYFEIC